jgi:hypothetical protein
VQVRPIATTCQVTNVAIRHEYGFIS